jgi:hypothetical protein
MPESAILRIYGRGDVPVRAVSKFLRDLERAYNGLIALDGLLPKDDFLWPYRGFAFYPTPWVPTDEQLSRGVSPSERLTLYAVRLQSPGFWDFLGSLNLLETIRRMMNDHHEREKDRNYRNDDESQRLDLENDRRRLENMLLREDIVAKKIANAKSLGASDRDLAPVLNGVYLEPMLRLTRHQDEGVIGHAEIRSIDKKA